MHGAFLLKKCRQKYCFRLLCGLDVQINNFVLFTKFELAQSSTSHTCQCASTVLYNITIIKPNSHLDNSHQDDTFLYSHIDNSHRDNTLLYSHLDNSHRDDTLLCSHLDNSNRDDTLLYSQSDNKGTFI